MMKYTSSSSTLLVPSVSAANGVMAVEKPIPNDRAIK
jgi:hypothetical protein